jgi:preprotein translocase subunit YajC
MMKMSLTDVRALFIAEAAAPRAVPAGSAGYRKSCFLRADVRRRLYFLMIAPQRKKAEGAGKNALRVTTGDEVVTTGGIFGEITNVKEDRFVVRVADNTKIEVGKGFIQSVIEKAGR